MDKIKYAFKKYPYIISPFISVLSFFVLFVLRCIVESPFLNGVNATYMLLLAQKDNLVSVTATVVGFSLTVFCIVKPKLIDLYLQRSGEWHDSIRNTNIRYNKINIYCIVSGVLAMIFMILEFNIIFSVILFSICLGEFSANIFYLIDCFRDD